MRGPHALIAIRRGFRGLARERTDDATYAIDGLPSDLLVTTPRSECRPFPLVACLLLDDRLTFEDTTVRIDPLARTNPGIFLLSQEIPKGRYASVRSVPCSTNCLVSASHPINPVPWIVTPFSSNEFVHLMQHFCPSHTVTSCPVSAARPRRSSPWIPTGPPGISSRRSLPLECRWLSARRTSCVSAKSSRFPVRCPPS